MVFGIRTFARTAALVLSICLALIFAPAASALASSPTLAAVNPNNGPLAGGGSAVLTGSGFLAGGTPTVRFGTVAATVQFVGQSEIRVTVPPASRSELVNVTVTTSGGTSTVVAKDQFAYDAPPAAKWLGLDGNSSGVRSDHLGDFVAHGIVYDRGGAPGIDWQAGEVLSNGTKATAAGSALATSVQAGMIPDVVIEYRGYRGNYTSDPNFPQQRTAKEEEEGKPSIKEYVAGFVKSAKAIHEKYPSALFEPMNEPWGYTTPQYDGAEYANVIASLIPEAQAAGIPLASIYVGATGEGCVRPGECRSNGWVPSMYEAQPSLTRAIQGWYLHPYGPPNGVGEFDGVGIQSVPVVQSAMTSGQNNIIVSEVGYCVFRVNGGKGCGKRERPGRAARNMTEMLRNALAYRNAGWLRALIVYARSDGGWAMQFNGSTTLTKSGKALDAFADAHGSPSSTRGRRRKRAKVASLSAGVSCASFLACAVVGDRERTRAYLQ
jgi:hypothetical protein